MLGPATLVTFDQVANHLDRGTEWKASRTTASQVYTVITGSGYSRIGEHEFEWQRGDMIAAPSWQDQVHNASENTVLLRVSDEPLMRMLNWYHTGEGMAAAKGYA